MSWQGQALSKNRIWVCTVATSGEHEQSPDVDITLFRSLRRAREWLVNRLLEADVTPDDLYEWEPTGKTTGWEWEDEMGTSYSMVAMEITDFHYHED